MSGPYIQHNPLFPNGLDAIVGYIKQAGRIPCEVKRVAIDGDLAFVHVRYLDWGGQETAGVDIFRFDADGKVVEHWDVLQRYQHPRTTPTICSRESRTLRSGVLQELCHGPQGFARKAQKPTTKPTTQVIAGALINKGTNL